LKGEITQSAITKVQKECAMDWMDSTRLADYCFMNQNGLHCDVFWIPRVIVKDIWSVAKVATHLPLHSCYCFPVGYALL